MTDLAQIIRTAAERAIDGELTDAERVTLYKLALTVAAAELHRVEQVNSGSVSPEALLILQQIGLLCDEGVDAERLLGGMGLITSEYLHATQDEDSGSSEQTPS